MAILVVTNFSFDAERLKNRLSRLSRRHVLTFGVWQLERMVPNFIQFCVETKTEGTWVLKCVVSYAWSAIETGNLNFFDRLTVEDCERIAPDTEDFESLYTSAALDVVVSASKLIEYILINDTNLIVEMANLARDSADILIQLSNDADQDDEDFEEVIRTHPLMQSELQHQEADILFLECLLEDRDHFFSAVLARSLTQPYGRKWL